MFRSRLRACSTLAVSALLSILLPVLPGSGPLAGTPAGAATAGVRAVATTTPPRPAQDPFYVYRGSTPLRDITPGTVLKRRDISVHLSALPLPVQGRQLLYRTTDMRGKPLTTVATVLRPVIPPSVPKLLSYQSFYDSTTPDCEPSYVLAGGFDRGLISTSEVPILVQFLLQGYTVVTADFEGQKPAFAAGPTYGRATLDGIRAALRSGSYGLRSDTRIGLIGYSGGAIASEWATELAPAYAPGLSRRMVGTAIGGVLVHPAHNLGYVDGSLAWAGVAPLALIGVARSLDIDLRPYLSDKGLALFTKLQDACFFTDVYGQYPGLRYRSLVKPQYADPTTIGFYVDGANRLIMGRTGTPTVPLFVRQGANGVLEGTPAGAPGIGPGDGVMIAGDVRTLARQYCARGVKVDYQEYPLLSHVPATGEFFAGAVPWLAQRFRGVAPRSSCGTIKPGNALTPLRHR